MTEIKKLTQELYERLGCAGAPRAKTAKLLEQIDLEADRLVERNERLARLSAAYQRWERDPDDSANFEAMERAQLECIAHGDY